ncbi:hypothetical protein EVAR_41910_1 [Eumeta japonica]|uniref:Uncharacterized protein n=1 Tax=Eumeta variegata TaxID=151549 RepID=A0A4C1XK02_EUMVA|nr:hypothetical protein EVAR_41910_1 [Eumeta japonica]
MRRYDLKPNYLTAFDNYEFRDEEIKREHPFTSHVAVNPAVTRDNPLKCTRVTLVPVMSRISVVAVRCFVNVDTARIPSSFIMPDSAMDSHPGHSRILDVDSGATIESGRGPGFDSNISPDSDLAFPLGIDWFKSVRVANTYSMEDPIGGRRTGFGARLIRFEA